MRSIFMILILLGSWSLAYAENGGRGGDPDGLDFQSAAAKGIMRIGGLNLDISIPDLVKVMERARYLVVEKPLYATLNGIRQKSPATNDPVTQIVKVYRRGWHRIRDEAEREYLAAHEVLSLAGIESTGDYHVSSKLKTYHLKAEFMVVPKTLLYNRFDDVDPSGFTYQQAMEECEIQKTRYENKYYFTYCSYIQKCAEWVDDQCTGESSYGLQVYGIGFIDDKLPWITVISSQTLITGLPLEFDTQEEATDSCYNYLSGNLHAHPLWTRPRCEVKADHSKFYFEIQTQNPFLEN